MKQTLSQKALRIISILQFISGLVFIFLFGLLFYSLKYEETLLVFKNNSFEAILAVVKLFVNGALLFISWYILKAVSKDASKHNIALTVTLVVIAYEVFNFITSLGIGVPEHLLAMVLSVLLNLVCTYLISNVRNSYQKYLNENKTIQ